MSDTKTPRTEAERERKCADWFDAFIGMANLAEQLETELAAMKASHDEAWRRSGARTVQPLVGNSESQGGQDGR